MQHLFETPTPGSRIVVGILLLILTLVITIGLMPLALGLFIAAGLDHSRTIDRIFALGIAILIAAIPFVGLWIAVCLFRKPKAGRSMEEEQ